MALRPVIDRPAFLELGELPQRPCVYFIEAGPLIKIGRTGWIVPRLAELERVIPVPIRLVAVIQVLTIDDTRVLESELHLRFAEYRHHGEWFDLPAGWMDEVGVRAMLVRRGEGA